MARPKGSKNKLTVEVKDMVRGALEDAGGRKYLLAQAKEKPDAFLRLVGRLIPADVRAELTGIPPAITIISGFPDPPAEQVSNGHDRSAD